MTDTTQGADAPNENALFNEAVSTDTLAKFENPPVAPGGSHRLPRHRQAEKPECHQ
jgi:hypothetical protein